MCVYVCVCVCCVCVSVCVCVCVLLLGTYGVTTTRKNFFGSEATISFASLNATTTPDLNNNRYQRNLCNIGMTLLFVILTKNASF